MLVEVMFLVFLGELLRLVKAIGPQVTDCQPSDLRAQINATAAQS